MGVTGLWKLIEQSGKPVPLDTLEGKILAIDISIWLHQVTKGFQDGKGGSIPNAHLLGLFNRLCKLLYYRIKPVFIFDGDTPQLKRLTIEKRSMQRSKLNADANRIEQILLETLAQEKIVQQALGKSVEHLVSPSKNRAVREKISEDEMFKLPPMEGDLGIGLLEESSDEDGIDVDNTETEVTASDELQQDIMDFFDKNIMKVDVNSSLFKSLPPDKRHAILFEMKEARKQSSWGRLHEMPQDGETFAEFQMKRLLKRRQVQVSLETAENEMGGRCLTLGELEDLMAEDGIVEPTKTNTNMGQRIASDKNTRFLLVKDIKKAIEESKKTFENEQLKKIDGPSTSNSNNQSQEEIDLQMAIAMSLQDDPANLTQVDVLKTSDIKLSTPQRQKLKGAAKASARDYMLEFGVLNDDDIKDMFKKKDVIEEEDINKTITNSTEIEQESAKDIIVSESEQIIPEEENISISSSTDTDFIDVPEDDFSNKLFANVKAYPFPEGSPSKDFRLEDLRKFGSAVQVLIDPKKAPIDDIFADVFSIAEVPDIKKSINNEPQNVELKEIKKRSFDEILEISDSDSDLVEPIVDSAVEKKQESPHKKLKLDQISQEIIIGGNLEIKKSSLLEFSTSIPDDDLKGIKKRDRNIIEIELETSNQVFENEVLESPTKKLRSEVKKSSQISNAVSPEIPQIITSPKQSIDLTVKEPQPSTSNVSFNTPKVKKIEDPAILQQMEQDLFQRHRHLEREMNKLDRQNVSITEKMSLECEMLLKLFGVPFLTAPMEAEAQCAFLNAQGFVDGIISDDSDVWLFGGNTVYKNFFDNKKNVLEYKAANIERLFKMDRKKLIQLAMLVGSDYTTGIHGVGPVTALEILATFNSPEDCTDESISVISCLRKFREWFINGKTAHSTEITNLKKKLKGIELSKGFPNLEVVKAYLYPEVDISDEPFSWGAPDEVAIYDFTKKYLGWTQSKTEDVLGKVMTRINEKNSQATITNYFKVTSIERHQDLVVSKRVKQAIKKLNGHDDSESVEAGTSKKKKNKTKSKKNTDESSAAKEKKSNNKKGKSKTNNKVETDTVDLTSSQEKIGEEVENVSPSKSLSKLIQSKKTPRIPDPNPPIMQRVRDEKLHLEAKSKAAEIFKKNKCTKK